MHTSEYYGLVLIYSLFVPFLIGLAIVIPILFIARHVDKKGGLGGKIIRYGLIGGYDIGFGFLFTSRVFR